MVAGTAGVPLPPLPDFPPFPAPFWWSPFLLRSALPLPLVAAFSASLAFTFCSQKFFRLSVFSFPITSWVYLHFLCGQPWSVWNGIQMRPHHVVVRALVSCFTMLVEQHFPANLPAFYFVLIKRLVLGSDG